MIHATRVAVPNAGSSIEGMVTLASSVTVPACPAGTPRSLADFVPTATAATLEDANQSAVVRAGLTDAGGAFTIGNVAPDSYALGAMDVTVGDQQTGSWKLSFTTTVLPTSATVTQGQNVTGVAYTVTNATCTQL